MYIGMNTMGKMQDGPAAWWAGVTTATADSITYGMKAYTMYNLRQTADGLQVNGISESLYANQTANTSYTPSPVMTVGMLKQSRTATWQANWRSSDTRTAANASCSDDGFSWPHRTLGWKMLKDDLFGIDTSTNGDGQPRLVSVGETRSFNGSNAAAHDVDSVCLDCHNPTIWNATSAATHTDTADNPYNDDLLMRGLP
jgi:hypothetical protein